MRKCGRTNNLQPNANPNFSFGLTSNFQLYILTSSFNINQRRLWADGILIPHLRKAQTRYLQFLMTIPNNIKHKIFEVLNENGDLLQFEAWLYANPEIENTLPADLYFDLIEFNYKQHDAKNLFDNMVKKFINKGEFEEWKIRKLLTEALNNGKELPEILKRFYDFYCRGYSFFDNLGLGYGLSVVAEDYGEEKLKAVFPNVKVEIEKVIHWLDSKKVILTGLQDEYNNYEYLDYRTIEERKPSSYSIANTPEKNIKPWWKFW